VEVRYELPEALPELVLDDQLLHQALVNLLVNAFHAMPSGGHLILRAALSPETGTLRLEVEDDGPGIPAALGQRIFQPFVTTKAFGTGLGLAVVRRIADAHGGRIELQEGARGGARFVLCVRLAGR
jgi:signal transduction histidine kinase